MLKKHLVSSFLVAVLAASLRLPNLDVRPMHADEAILADKFGTLLATGAYDYDPAEYHGPLLAHASRIPAYLSGKQTYAALTETVLRIIPAIAGVVLALLPLLLAGALGERAAIAAALFVAVSPVCVYYSRDYIPEMLLALFTALLLIALWRISVSNSVAGWVCAGAAGGAAVCTKETALIAFAAAAAPFAIICRPKLLWQNLLACGGAAVLVILLFVNPLLLVQSFSEYWSRGVRAQVHLHPPQYYLSLLTGAEGRFVEALPVALAAVAFILPAPHLFARFLKWFAILLTAIYSAIPYKTPWCAVSLMFAYALIAGLAVQFGLRKRPFFAPILILAGYGHLAWQAWQASNRYAADPGNQWAYAQTTPDVFAMRDQIAKSAAASTQGRLILISIYSQENLWPLPWYLREYPNVGWSRDIPLKAAAAPIVLASPAMEPLLQRKFYEGPPPGQRELYMNLFPTELYLRPGIPVRGYVVKSLWDRI